MINAINSKPGPETHDVDDAAAYLADRVSLLFNSLPLALAGVLINSAILSAVQWRAVNQANVSIWFGLILAVSSFRLGLYYRFRHKADSTDAGPWFKLFLIGVLCSGLLWGSAAYLLLPDNNPTHQLFVIFVLGGMSAGAVTTLAASLQAVLLFLLPAIGPLIVRLVQLDSPLSNVMAGMVALFLLMVSIAAWRSRQLITESLRRRYRHERAEAAMEFQAYHDSLTELPNRRLLVQRLEQEISRSKRHQYFAAVLFIDIDRFKTINDSLGHAVGDGLLREVARRLKRNVREEDTAARLGGDEFVIVLSELGTNDTLAVRKTQRLAEKLDNLLSEPYAVEGHTLHTTPSIGIAMFPVDSADAEEVLKQSDIAMYRAKQLGRNTIQFYLPSMQQTAKLRLDIENELREALNRNEMELYFQPQLQADGRLVGAETLLRWNHPQRGMVSPAEFIPVAEETGTILVLGEWVLRAACLQLKSWMDAADPDSAHRFPNLAINVSPKQFRQQDFFQRVLHIIKQTGVDPNYVELELTEGMLIENIEDTAAKMEQLSDLGVRLSIDDFGTGYSSLHYLTRLHLDRIKIDQSFVRDVPAVSRSAVIVETIIIMARNLGLDVIAEGVETESQLNFLRENGCYTYQGFYFSKPLPCDKFLRYLQAAN